MVKKIPPRSQDPERRILAAARAEFVTKGMAGARMQAIARAARVNSALLHYYFRSKEKLYAAAARDVVRTVWGAMQKELAALPPEKGFEETLATMLKAHARVLSRHPDFPLFLLRQVLEEASPLPEILHEALQAFAEIPRRLQRLLEIEIRAGRFLPMEPVHFWTSFVGMTVAGYLAPRLLQKVRSPWARRVRYARPFLLQRAEMVAATMARALRAPGGTP
jgi:AcrR family transcriptional regulator